MQHCYCTQPGPVRRQEATHKVSRGHTRGTQGEQGPHTWHTHEARRGHTRGTQAGRWQAGRGVVCDSAHCLPFKFKWWQC